MPSEYLGRRDALKIISTTVIGCYVGIGCAQVNSLDTSDYFPQSVASGDPHSDRVILWTRVVDQYLLRKDYSVFLEVATDETFLDIVISQNYMAQAALDHCLRIKVTSLDPNTYYYYRFTYAGVHSRTGRTKTLPAENDMRTISLAMVYGQDYIGRYYNPYAHLLRHHEPDLILHLGDYIYETTGDPTFQVRQTQRNIIFDDIEHAQKIEWNDIVFYAANSLENYRQLYRQYRSDPILQALHERFPMVAIWDDHEYRDDYAGGSAKERYRAQRLHARRAYLEYMPLEVGLESVAYFSSENPLIQEAEKPPVLYRDFKLGGVADLLISDYRTYRPDLLIPRDAFPGKVFADHEEIMTLLEQYYPGESEIRYQKLCPYCNPYIDLKDSRYDNYKTVFRELVYQMYLSEGVSFIAAGILSSKAVSGKINLAIANKMITYHNEKLDADVIPLPLFHQNERDGQRKKGLSYADLGKYSMISDDGIGVSTMVGKDAFDLYALKYAQQDVYGEQQSQWIRRHIQTNTQPWLLFASSVSMTPMAVDLSDLDMLPEPFRKPLYINLDQFDGFPFARASLLESLSGHNALVLSGDIHAAFITNHEVVKEVTGPAVSSATAREMIRSKISTSTVLEHKKAILEALDSLDIDEMLMECNQICNDTGSSAYIQHADVGHHGYTLVDIDKTKITVSLSTLPFEYATQCLYGKLDVLDKLVETSQFVFIRDGTL